MINFLNHTKKNIYKLIKAIIFDFDGVILNSTEIKTNAFINIDPWNNETRPKKDPPYREYLNFFPTSAFSQNNKNSIVHMVAKPTVAFLPWIGLFAINISVKIIA